MDLKDNSRKLAVGMFAASSFLAGWSFSSAQVVTGQLGSPNATTTIEGKQIPAPPPKFGGVIKPSATESTQWWPPRVVPPQGAPNVLLIMTDDQGYGVSGTFGGVIPTPSLDRIANSGLRYIQFHSTALCSPTRAALITGRNHHSVGSGVIGELSTGYPGYDSIIGVENATIGTILRAAPPTAATSGQKTARECRDEWRANKAANQANGVTEKAYVAQCRSGAAPAQTTVVPPPPPTPAPTPTAAPAAPAPAPTAAPAAPAAAPTAGASGRLDRLLRRLRQPDQHPAFRQVRQRQTNFQQ